MQYLSDILILIVSVLLMLALVNNERLWKIAMALSVPLFFIVTGLLLMVLFTKWGIDEPGEIYYVIGLFTFFLSLGVIQLFLKYKTSKDQNKQ